MLCGPEVPFLLLDQPKPLTFQLAMRCDGVQRQAPLRRAAGPRVVIGADRISHACPPLSEMIAAVSRRLVLAAPFICTIPLALNEGSSRIAQWRSIRAQWRRLRTGG